MTSRLLKNLIKRNTEQKEVVFDIESNGLLDVVSQVWCIAGMDNTTKEKFLYHDYPELDGQKVIDEEGIEKTIPKRNGTMLDGIEFLAGCKKLICHNLINYDIPLMRKFYPTLVDTRNGNFDSVVDTLLMSKVNMFFRQHDGKPIGHGLADYGIRFGVHKPEVKDWSFIDAWKLHRCIEDIEINKLVYDKMIMEGEAVKKKYDLDFTDSYYIEHEYAHNCHKQETKGCLLDVEYVERCARLIDEDLGNIHKTIEDQIPSVCKPKGALITYGAMCSLLGITRQDLDIDNYELKKDEIEKIVKFNKTKFKPDATDITKMVPNKIWAKPDVKLFTATPITAFTIQHASITDEEQFDSKREAQSYIKEFYPETKLKDWSIEKIVLGKRLTASVENWLMPQVENEYLKHDEHTFELCGAFTRVEFHDVRLSQHALVSDWLLTVGWQPEKYATYKDEGKGKQKKNICHMVDGKWTPIYNYKSPVRSGTEYIGVQENIRELLLREGSMAHRSKMLCGKKGMLTNKRANNRLTSGIRSFGTVAGRGVHEYIVNVPKGDLEIQTANGIEVLNLRDAIICEKGRSLIGVDMPNAHFRILSYRTQNEAFLRALNEGKEEEEDGTFRGTDLHTFNGRLFGFISEEDFKLATVDQDHDAIARVKKGRAKGKTTGFAAIYGAGAGLLVENLGLTKAQADESLENFNTGLGIDVVKMELKQLWEHSPVKTVNKLGVPINGGFVTTYGNYHVLCDGEHKLINSLALGSEAVLQKKAINWINKQFTTNGLDADVILSMHDEMLIEVSDKHLELAKPFVRMGYEVAAQAIGIDNNFYGTIKTGMSYGKCH